MQIVILIALVALIVLLFANEGNMGYGGNQQIPDEYNESIYGQSAWQGFAIESFQIEEYS